MARRIFLLSFLIAILISLGVSSLKSFSKEERRGREADLGIISEKIDEVLKNQEDITARLEDIRSQQDIIRVRASRR